MISGLEGNSWGASVWNSKPGWNQWELTCVIGGGGREKLLRVSSFPQASLSKAAMDVSSTLEMGVHRIFKDVISYIFFSVERYPYHLWSPSAGHAQGIKVHYFAALSSIGADRVFGATRPLVSATPQPHCRTVSSPPQMLPPFLTCYPSPPAPLWPNLWF